MSRVALILAAIDASQTIRTSLARFQAEVAGRGEVLLVDASRDGTADEAARVSPGVRILRRPPGRLAPELWADGLRATDAPLVAFSTAQMAPHPGWLDRLRDGLGAHAAVGGPIVPSRGLRAIDRAVYLLRYSPYLPPASAIEPPGENALYRRDRLPGLESAPALVPAFWEAEVHRRLRARGDRLAMAPGAVVEFLGGNRPAAMVRQRFTHARHYGAGRSRGRGLPHRLARSAAAPLVPPLLAMRIARTLRSRSLPLAPWLPATPVLALLATAWALGEAAGTCLGPPDRREVA